MELREALDQIAEIRSQMARTEVFRGYRAVPVAFSGVLAWCAAFYQAIWIRNPVAESETYLKLWVGAAALSALLAGTEMVARGRLVRSPLSRGITWLAVEQFLPSLLAGGVVTVAMVRAGEQYLWMLPGLWAILFGLGIFASCKLLPRATYTAAFYYLIAGFLALTFARDEHALSPWAMGLTFGVGQWLAAAVLYGTLERERES